MKSFYRSLKYRRFSSSVARHNLRRRLKRKYFLLIQRRTYHGKDLEQVTRIKDFATYKFHICAPENCSFLENTEEVISFVNKLEESHSLHRRVFVILKKVEKFDYAAIAVLLSVMSMFKIEKVGFNGDFPGNEDAKRLIIESGFFDHINRRLSQQQEEELQYIPGKDNQIFTHLSTNVVPDLGLPIMLQSSMTIWGERKIDGGLQSVLMELMQNTNNHAATGIKGEKHWWLSVNHDPSGKKVSFSFVDHGVGVLTSLDRKPPTSPWYKVLDTVRQGMGLQSNERFIDALLAGKLHETVTKKSYRGKGLPNIKRMLNFKKISALHIITNNVFANVANADYKLLNQSFKGTFFYWELSRDNVFKPWTITSSQ